MARTKLTARNHAGQASSKHAPSKEAALAAVRRKDGKPPFRRKPGRLALMEIRRLQKSVELLISKAGFHRLVRKIAMEMNVEIRFQAKALEALQEAGEAYLVGLFEECWLATRHAHRKTTMLRDLKFVLRVRGETDEQTSNCFSTSAVRSAVDRLHEEFTDSD